MAYASLTIFGLSLVAVLQSGGLGYLLATGAWLVSKTGKRLDRQDREARQGLIAIGATLAVLLIVAGVFHL